MAPGRKKGANRAKERSQLSPGDLVLAKVKGFPAWPAKISKPEDWNRPPDPKKYFVQFFGTAEIAFVAPADIQAFTVEWKTKLLARCQGKTVKDFSRAVKEICEAFEELQQKKVCPEGDADGSLKQRPPSQIGHAKDIVSVEGPNSSVARDDNLESYSKEHNDETVTGSMSPDGGHGLERCSLSRSTSLDVKDGDVGSVERRRSPILSVKKRAKTANRASRAQKGGVVSPRTVSLGQEQSSKLKNGSAEVGDRSPGVSDASDPDNKEYMTSSPVMKSISSKPFTSRGTRKGIHVSKAKVETSVEVKGKAVGSPKTELEDPVRCKPALSKHLKEEAHGVLHKGSCSDRTHELSSTSDADLISSKKLKSSLKDNKKVDKNVKEGAENLLNVRDHGKEPLDHLDDRKNGQALLSKDQRKITKVGGKGIIDADEKVRPVKRLRISEVDDDIAEESALVGLNDKFGASPNAAISKKGELVVGSESLSSQSSTIAALKSNTCKGGGHSSGDEDILPLTKRRRRALEAMSTAVADSDVDVHAGSPKLAKSNSSMQVENDVSISSGADDRVASCVAVDDDSECKKVVTNNTVSLPLTSSEAIADTLQTACVQSENSDQCSISNIISKPCDGVQKDYGLHC